MTKTALLAAAAMFAFCGNAFASSTTVSLDGFCNVFKVTTQDKKVHSIGPGAGDCDAPLGIGGDHKVKHSGQFVEAGTVFLNNGAGEIFTVKLSLPLVTGGTWELDVSTDGVNFSDINSGTYTVTGTGVKGPRGSRDAVLGR